MNMQCMPEDLNTPLALKETLYNAFRESDLSLDGKVFVGVSSTGIYCRPTCHAHMPKFQNCTFFHSAAQAESSGYRPCLMCRPELAPGLAPTDSTTSLARRAAVQLRAQCSSGESLEALATRLGYTSRHLRRAFVEEFGVTAVQYLQTCRLLLAKSLLTDTRIPIEQVAQSAGFGSTRRFNALFKDRYRLTPTQFRKKQMLQSVDGEITIYLAYRPPFDFLRLLSFFRLRQIEGVELVTEDTYARTVCVAAGDGAPYKGWVRVLDDPAHNRVALHLSETLLPVISQVSERVRQLFDLDASPQTVHRALTSLDELVPGANVIGTRVPGAFEPFETVCRAILGQQVSIAAANKLAARVAATYGASCETGIEGLNKIFPTAADLLALNPIEDALGQLGVIKSRSLAMRTLAQLYVSGRLDLGRNTSVKKQLELMESVKGIGPWTSNYICMRTMGYTDAFLETDVGIKHALPNHTPKQRLAIAEHWRPYRSYANVCLWNSLS